MIGIFDSGVGGLTVLRELLNHSPQRSYIYLGDTARAPYGSKAPETVKRYAHECARFLFEQKVEILVVACNTASSFALEILRDELPFPVIGTVLSASKLAVEKSATGRIGVIGTEATVSSGVYTRTLKELAPNVEVYSRACPLFVPLVEQGMTEGEIVEKIIALYLEELANLRIDTLILGCTHYPLLKDEIARYLGSRVEIIECSKSIAEEVAIMPAATHSEPLRQFFVTDGVERFNHLAEIFLANGAVNACKVEL